MMWTPNTPNRHLTSLLIILILLQLTNNQPLPTKMYPLEETIFRKIFLLRTGSQHYFLNANCRDKNIISITITPRVNFQDAPHYPIYGNMTDIPKNSHNHTLPFKYCEVEVQVNGAGIVELKRKNQKQGLFSIGRIEMKQKYTKIEVSDSSVKWGLGQRFQEHFEVRDGKWTIWNRDRPWKIDRGVGDKSEQTYGHQPVYLARQHSLNNYHLTYFKNTHGLMVQSERQSSKLTYHSVGGHIHFIVVMGGKDPQQTLQMYHQYIGRAHLPPFWSLGYHQSRWGYKSFEEVKTVVEKFELYDIPLDAFWLDLDYMDNKMIFTVDEKTYPSAKLNSLFEDNKLRLVPLLDVAIAQNDYRIARMGRNMDVFLKVNRLDQHYYYGEVWPGQVYYIDFLHPNATIYWQRLLQKLHQKINFAGVWLDMNEPTNFRGGGHSHQEFMVQKNQPLSTMTISPQLSHYQPQGDTLLHSEVHAYYGHLSVLPTFDYLNTKERPFVLTRSNSVGTGAFAAHWTGDNVASWEFLRSSINSNFLFQIFGIQMVGSDICGFYQNTQSNLCSRWMQLGSFYPFARNHNHEAATSQQPYVLGDTHYETSKISLKTRYALLKQMYTWMTIKKGKGSFFRPLFFQFFQDQITFEETVVESQFLIGRSLMVAPIIDANIDYREVYFPGEATWCQFQVDTTRGSVEPSSLKLYSQGWQYGLRNQLPSAPLTFLRTGSLIFSTYPSSRSSSLSNQFFVFGVLKNEQAKGTIMGVDDYENNNSIQSCLQGGCFYNLWIQKIQGHLVVEWSFQGEFEGVVELREWLLVEDGQVCVWKEDVKIWGTGLHKLSSKANCRAQVLLVQ